jgi:hypothetical protein
MSRTRSPRSRCARVHVKTDQVQDDTGPAPQRPCPACPQSAVLQDGPFDGLLGFSQGAALAAIVAHRRSELGMSDALHFCILAGAPLPAVLQVSRLCHGGTFSDDHVYPGIVG